MKLLILCLLVLYNAALIRTLDTASVSLLDTPNILETDSFRAMRLGPAVSSRDWIDCEELATLMLGHEMDLSRLKRLPGISLRIGPANRGVLFRLADGYRTVLSDLKCFPVPELFDPSVPEITYEDSWKDERSYGGERNHEGCDVMGDNLPSGFYPVVSMTDGTVEKIGWLEKGGYRIGIRSPSGAYFYYAHLSRYAGGLCEGTDVHAGELLGFMGDSGYGPEHTTGKFPVHLHVGIYLKTAHCEELSVNPYWILRYLEKKRTRARYLPETVVLFRGF
ncbi:MAG: M23 family metallopeptidase [Lachnospiraceae bacterium]|nr:M23 family metallopeptidase [Lachnospiraceae bacterium]